MGNSQMWYAFVFFLLFGIFWKRSFSSPTLKETPARISSLSSSLLRSGEAACIRGGSSVLRGPWLWSENSFGPILQVLPLPYQYPKFAPL